MKAISKEFENIYNSFISKHEDLAGAKCLPGAGWGTAKKIKMSGKSDESIAGRLFDGIKDGKITAAELRWFTPAQLTALKNKVITESKGDAAFVKKFEELFAKAFVLSHKRHHSEDKQKALFSAYEAIKNVSGLWKKTTPPRQTEVGKRKGPPPQPPARSVDAGHSLTQASQRQITTAPQQGKNPAFLAARKMIAESGTVGTAQPGEAPKVRKVAAQPPAPVSSPVVSTKQDEKRNKAADEAINRGEVPPPPPPPANGPKVKKTWAKVEVDGAPANPEAKGKSVSDKDKKGQVGGDMADKVAEQARARAERLAARNAKKGDVEGK